MDEQTQQSTPTPTSIEVHHQSNGGSDTADRNTQDASHPVTHHVGDSSQDAVKVVEMAEATPVEQPAVGAIEQPVLAAPIDQTITTTEDHVANPIEQLPAEPLEQAMASIEQPPVAPIEQAMVPAEQALVPPIEQADLTPVEQNGIPAEQAMPPVEQAPGPIEQTITPVQQDDVIQTEMSKDVAAGAAETEEEGGIAEPTEHDVLNGRGASVNAHSGNKKFRALCFSRKPEFEAGNHAAKRRIATEIVGVAKMWPARFLKKKSDKGYWFELSTEKAILKACQVMRDFQRPDRVALREMAAANGNRKRQRTGEPSTPGVEAPPTTPLDPIVENPYGVHSHDVLSGRGAFVNGHVGNQRFRTLALERKTKFDAGNYSEKRALATEVVQIIRNLDPPGRFLKRVTNRQNKPAEDNNWIMPPRGLEGFWEELTDEKAIHKACQVMRDIDRPDRGPEKRTGFKSTKVAAAAITTVDNTVEPTATSTTVPVATPTEIGKQEADPAGEQVVTTNAAMTLLAASSSNAPAPADGVPVEADVVAAAEAAIENTLGDGVPTPMVESKPPPEAVDSVQV